MRGVLDVRRELPSLREIQAVLFDLDGTLFETDNRWAAMLADRLRPLERVCPFIHAERLARRIVMSLEMPSNYVISLIEHLGIDTNILGLADRLRRSKGLATREEVDLVDGTEELLEALWPRFRLAVVTTRARAQAYELLERAGLGRFFSVVVTRQDVLRMKPHPEPVLKAARQLGVPSTACVMVGDTPMDVKAARRAGAIAVAVLTGFGSREELARSRPDMMLERASALLAYLGKGRQNGEGAILVPTSGEAETGG